MKCNIRFLPAVGLVICLGGCQNGSTISPQSPSLAGSPSPAPTPAPSHDDIASLAGSYLLNGHVLSADAAVGCDQRRTGLEENLQIDLRVDSNSRVVEADIVRYNGATSHLRGTVNDSFVVTASSIGSPGTAGPGDPQCAGSASETLTFNFAGPNYDGCQGYTVRIETQYSFAFGKIVEGFFHEPC